MFSHLEVTKDIERAKKFIENIISYTVSAYTLEEMIKYRLEDINIIDVRDYDDYIEGHIPYAIHFPTKEINEHLGMLKKDKINILYTYSDNCSKAYNAAMVLLENNFPCVILRGGFKFWKKHDFDIVKNSSSD